MKRSRFLILFALTTAMVLVTAATAYAGPGGTVYGQATMQPTVSIVLSGAGADSGNPLVYTGTKGSWVPETNFNRVTVTNNGDVNVPLMLGFGSDPTDGVSTWTLGAGPDETRAEWELMSPFMMNAMVPSNGSAPNSFGPQPLFSGDSVWFDSGFRFPSSYDGTPHTMTALIIAGE